VAEWLWQLEHAFANIFRGDWVQEAATRGFDDHLQVRRWLTWLSLRGFMPAFGSVEGASCSKSASAMLMQGGFASPT
jgi:hypothetical protein